MEEIVTKFLQEPDPAMYDFREEIVTFHTNDPIDRYNIYKAMGIAEGVGYISDPVYFTAWGLHEIHKPKEGEADSCDLLQNIFRQLYINEEIDYLAPCMDRNQIKGDTMNSVFTTLAEFLDARGRKRSNRRTLEFYLNGSFREKVSPCVEAVHFLRVAYTLGNFILCPKGCNGPRGMGNSKDYWDLVLACIYNYYEPEKICMAGDKPYSIEWLLGDKERKPSKAAITYMEWLDSFGRWQNFLEKNFFVSKDQKVLTFLEKNLERKLVPKELWKGHFAQIEEGNKDTALPKDKSQIKEFFTNAARAIEERGGLMVDELKKHDGKVSAS